MRRLLLWLFAGVAVLVVGAVSAGLVVLGPRNLLGLVRYGHTREGALKVGEPAPDVELIALGGGPRMRLRDAARPGQPLIVVFGSFT